MVMLSSLIAVRIRHLTVLLEIIGSNPMEAMDPFSKKALHNAILHLYLQQPGIIKMFLLCNIPGNVLIFFLNKQDIMRVNSMQNVTKNYILLRNVAYVLNWSIYREITLEYSYLGLNLPPTPSSVYIGTTDY